MSPSVKQTLTIAAVLLAMAGVGCKKTPAPSTTKSVQTNNNLDSLVFMSAVINGNEWKADSAFGYKVKSSGNDTSFTNLMITAIRKNNGNRSTITFVVSNYKGISRYNVNPPIVTATYYEGPLRHYATYGDVTITSVADYSLIGTFYFNCDSLAVNGSFNVAMP